MQDSETWFPEQAHDLVFMALAMAGEVGEFCNVLKKIERGSLEHDPESHLSLAMELTDVFIYMANIAAVLNIDLGKAYDQKREFNAERFGDRVRARNTGSDSATEAGVLRVVQSPDGEG
jgi:NTP pyrophosphatase (non-canonical NTP hydrolase)